MRNIEDVVGGSSADFIEGNNLANALFGGDGDDALAGDGGLDRLDGGAGTDTAYFTTYNVRVVADLSAGGYTVVTIGGVNDDTLRNVENLISGSDDDILIGAAGSTYIDGGSGNDYLVGGTAGVPSLTLSGGDQNDALVSRGDAVSLYGGANDDQLFVSGGGANFLDGGDGVDIADFAGASGRLLFGITADPNAGETVYTLEGAGDGRVRAVEHVVGTGFGDVMLTSGAAVTLDGNDGDDLLTGGTGDDVLNGGDGDDTLTGGMGLDALYGGAGLHDVASFADQSGPVKVRLLDDGLATVTFRGVSDDTLANIEDLVGGTGNDRLTGDAADNRLSGGDRADTLSGGSGNDVLVGGAGNDTHTGGSNADTFVFAAASGKDAITDFGKGDVIEIDVVGVETFADLRIKDDGAGGALVIWKGGSVDLAGVATTSVKASASHFGADAPHPAAPAVARDHAFHPDALPWPPLTNELLAIA